MATAGTRATRVGFTFSFVRVGVRRRALDELEVVVVAPRSLGAAELRVLDVEVHHARVHRGAPRARVVAHRVRRRGRARVVRSRVLHARAQRRRPQRGVVAEQLAMPVVDQPALALVAARTLLDVDQGGDQPQLVRFCASTWS